jgi:hypothetical protein
MSQLLGQCVGLISGREWQAVRKVAEVPFGHRAISLRIADFERHVLIPLLYLVIGSMG